ncbi:MAG: hypothetical protein WCE75_03590 [Terracidiphilus sp.]
MANAAAEPQSAMEGFVTEEQRKLADGVRAGKMRQRQTLEMQRERVLAQKTGNPGRRAALEAALEQIEGDLAKLG